MPLFCRAGFKPARVRWLNAGGPETRPTDPNIKHGRLVIRPCRFDPKDRGYVGLES